MAFVSTPAEAQAPEEPAPVEQELEIQAATSTATTTEEVEEVEQPTEPVKQKRLVSNSWIDLEGKKELEERFGVGHPLVEVSRCEAGYAQYNSDGTIRKNPNSSAIGQFQIMASLHESNANSMGMDIRTPEGNQDYAEYLYNRNGLRDWNESKGCWS